MRSIILILCLILLSSCEKDEINSPNVVVENRNLPCDTPTGLLLSDITSTSIKVSWNKNTTASKYRVEWASLASGVWMTQDVNDTITTIQALYVGHTYKIRVKSICEGWVNGTFLGSTSAPTVEIEFTTLNTSGACVDMYENNNDRSVAKPIIINRAINAKISNPTVVTNRKGTVTLYDNDWFIFNTSNRFIIKLDQLPKNYDIQLFRGNNGVLVSTSNNIDTISEQITYPTLSRNERYYIRVFAPVDVFDNTYCYRLKVTTF
jgi:hypothetical protein